MPQRPDIVVKKPPPEDEFIDPGVVPGQTHWVQPGETLYSIARRYYGNENQWRKIYYANEKRLSDPDNIPAGIKLIIP